MVCGALCLSNICVTGTASAQALPDTENGRYTLAPVADGVLRLDTRTGTMSTCNDRQTGWACYAMPDERAALDAEIGRLQKDNAALRARLAQRESPTGADSPRADAPERDAAAGETRRRLELTLPSDRDINQAIGVLERAWRRLVEMANRMQKDVSGKI
ncbi:MAG: hypothetical protein M9932_14695 [Xanthobacteraceae bacterium]|nr:hypothetical protein [Xanthobacteraceae bacterium]